MTALMRLKILPAAALAFVGVAWFSAVDPASASVLARCEASAANPSNTFLAEECQRERDEQARLAAEEQAQWDAALASPNPCAVGVHLPIQGQFCGIENWREVTESCRTLEGYESDPRLIAVCWKYQAIQKVAQRPKELREMRRAAEVRRERERERREWAHKPTVTLVVAKEFARRLMRKTDFSIWSVDCKGGRINRIRWSCKVSIFYQCLRGRIQVYGAGYRDGRKFFGAHGGRLRRCRA
jgi:hypothetical protein